MFKNLKKKLIAALAIAALIVPLVSYAARTDNLWDYPLGGNYYKTNGAPQGVDILINGSNHYLNWGSVSGTSGYGIRDNAGTIECKNSGGGWSACASGGGGSFGTSSARQSISETITGIDYDNSTGIFSDTSGYGIPLTASTTNWNDFYTTPSNRITPGTFLSWVGNTLNVSTSTMGIPATSSIRAMFTNSATGLTYTNTTGDTALTSGYNIPLTASTTDWQTAYTNRITSVNNDTNVTGTIGSNALTLGWTGTLADSRVADNLTISGGTVNNTPIGASTPSTAVFSNATSTTFTTTNLIVNSQSFNNLLGTGLGNVGGTLTNTGVTSIGGLTGAVATSSLGITSSQWITNGSDIYRASGKVGIGTTTPGSTLDIWGNLNVATGTNPSLFVDTANNLIGIGTSTPQARLHIVNYKSGGGFVSPYSSLLISSSSGATLFDVGSSGGVTIGNFSDGNSSLAILSTSTSIAQDLLFLSNSDRSTSSNVGIAFGVGGGSSGNLIRSLRENGSFVSTGAPKAALAFYANSGSSNALAVVKMLMSDAGNLGLGLFSATSLPPSKLSVVGNAAIGATYAASGAAVAPTSGLIVEGSVGIGTAAPLSSLSVAAGTAIGSTYAGGTAAPTNGLIVEGNVGIGKTVPGAKLHVESTPASNNPNIAFGASTAISGTESAALTFLGNTIAHAGISYVPATGSGGKLNFAFGGNSDPVNDTSMLTVQENGNVGIGTTTPDQLLTVFGNQRNATLKVRASDIPITGSKATLMLTNSDGFDVGKASWGLQTGYPDQVLQFLYSTTTESLATEYARFSSSGSFGLGTTTPGASLNVVSNGIGTLPALFTGFSSSQSADIFRLAKNPGATAGLVFTAGGNLGIGSTSPVQKIDVVGNIAATGYMFAGQSGPSSYQNVQGTYVGWNRLLTIGETDFINHKGLGTGGFSFDLTSNGSSFTNLMTILGSGNVGIGTTSPSTKLDIWGNFNFGVNAIPLLFGDTSGGFLGVGTSTPSARLQVASLIDSTADIFAVSSSTARVFAITSRYHNSSGGTAPAVSTCGTSPTIVGDDTRGTITTSGTVTACTITFNKVYEATPVCNVNINKITLTYGITAISTTAMTVTISASLGTGIIYYSCGVHQ